MVGREGVIKANGGVLSEAIMLLPLAAEDTAEIRLTPGSNVSPRPRDFLGCRCFGGGGGAAGFIED